MHTSRNDQLKTYRRIRCAPGQSVRKTSSSSLSSCAKTLPHDAYFYLNRDTCPMPFETPLFRGRAVVRVRGAKDAPKTRYFDGKRRMFSIQVEGRFRRRILGDSVIFGAAFDHPVVLPYGTSLVLALLHRIDPAVQEDLQGPQPWAMSPLLCAMSRISVRHAPPRHLPENDDGHMPVLEMKFSVPGNLGVHIVLRSVQNFFSVKRNVRRCRKSYPGLVRTVDDIFVRKRDVRKSGSILTTCMVSSFSRVEST